MAARLVILMFVFMFGFFFGQRKTTVLAQSAANVAKARRHCVGENQSALFVDDSNGVVRVVRLIDGEPFLHDFAQLSIRKSR